MSPVLQRLGIEVVEEKCGEGGSAVVHKGRILQKIEGFPDPGTYIAIKEYKPSVLSIPNQVARIRQEGELGRQIDHPNVVRVYGHFISGDQSEPCFLFMEWIAGDTLDVWSQSLRKNAAWERLRQICLNLVEGLAALHAKGIVHRDLKPENVMVVDDVAKIMDVGVAQITDNNEHTMHTAVKDFVGSVRYASPQFILGDEFDVSDDVYSLGATYLELLTGQRPYDEVERKPVLPIVVVQGTPRIPSFRENVPSTMKILIEGCLNRNRDRRPSLQQVREVLNDEAQAAYIQREIQLRATDQRGYKIVQMDVTGGGFYADVGADSPRAFEEYTVVRKDKPVSVPSLNTSIEPEMWVASAELRHVHQSLAHFKLTGKRWVEGRLTRGLLDVGGLGHWEEFDKKNVEVMVGDYVLKKVSDS